MKLSVQQNSTWVRKIVVVAGFVICVATLYLTSPLANAQNSTTGSIAGTVSDSTGAMVPNAKVVVKDIQTGSILNLNTNSRGHFIAPYLKPDKFTVSASAPGMHSAETSIQVLVGQESEVSVTVTPSSSSQVVTVRANDAQLIDTQTSNLTTTYTTAQFQNLPAPGGDLNTIAFTVPGVVVNASTGGSGDFSSDGLPGVSNLIIIDGADYNDPFLNVAESGASNMTIGQQEIAQSSLVQNGYSVEYGRQAGAILTFVTKSGTNKLHGLLWYSYNTDAFNANDFFNNLLGVPRGKAVSNQYAAQIGGPILRNKLFFFVDTEGIRYALPVSEYVNYPTPQLQNTILNTLPGGPQGASSTLYSQLFKVLQGAPTYSTAVPVTNGPGPLQDSSGTQGCGSIAGTPVFGTANEYFGSVPANAPVGSTAIPCANAAFAPATGINTEYEVMGRVNWQINDHHEAFVRITHDNGFQPTFTSVLNPTYSVTSYQPTYTGQLNDTYTFTSNLVNEFILSGLWYSAIFNHPNLPATLQLSPVSFHDPNDAGTNSQAGFGEGGFMSAKYLHTPQGTDVTQWQIVNNTSWLKGNHNFKFGVNFRRNDVSDQDNQIGTFGGTYDFGDAADLAGGTLPGTANSSYNLAFTTLPTAHSALYNVGFYAQDEWRVSQKFVLDYGIRVDRDGNPACTTSCFPYYAGGFPQAGATLNTAYNSTITLGHRSAFSSIQKAIIQPRVGFNWDVTGHGSTVLRGGAGLFADDFPDFVIASEYGAFPNVFSPAIGAGNVGTGSDSASAVAIAQASDQAFSTGFSQGYGANQLAAALPAGAKFAEPTFSVFPNEFLSPKFVEWSLQLQKQLSPTNAIIVSYAGNYGFDLLIGNDHLNQNLGGTQLADGQHVFNPSKFQSFAGLPLSSPDPRFGEINEITNQGISNYNGLMFTYKHIDNRGLTADVSYTYSHSLDDLSNGGVETFNGTAIGAQITPFSPSLLMYSNSDYDIRNNFVMDITYVEPNHYGNKMLNLAAAGWTLAGKAYWRSGEPFSIVNTATQNALFNGTAPRATVLADVLNNNFSHVCKSYGHPCFQTAGIFNGTNNQDNYGNFPRNSFYGPHYADIDLSVYKDLLNLNKVQFQLGAQMYNALNHVNFAAPGNNASNTATLGQISSDVEAPTSPYGTFEGASVSGRVIVVQGRLTF